MRRACYRSLKRYKYQLMEDYEGRTTLNPDRVISLPYLYLGLEGDLLIKKGYCWDGPSGPTWDTRNSMRGSLVHDALYQLLRLGLLNPSQRWEIDENFRAILRVDGMSKIRAEVWYRSVRWFAGWAAKVGTYKPVKLLRAPPERKP